MKQFIALSMVFALFAFTACDDDDSTSNPPPSNTIILDITGLEDIGPDYLYEGWIIIDGTPVTTGTFSVNTEGILSETEFDLADTDVGTAEAFVLTIEPNPDSDPAPSKVHLIGGSFSDKTADLTTAFDGAIGTDFSSAAGTYILATPTNGENSDELSGIWWLNPPPNPSASLVLPEMNAGWQYEGWVVIGGTPVTTGTFTDVADFDNDDPYSSTMAGPPFPGEDFLVNAPMGLTFPTDLSGAIAVISVEPVPDTSPAPFLLKPLIGNIPTDAADHTSYTMANEAAGTLPSGTATRLQ